MKNIVWILYIYISHEIYYDKNKKLITGYWHFRFTRLLLLIEKNLSDRVEWVSGKTYSDFVNFFYRWMIFVKRLSNQFLLQQFVQFNILSKNY